MDKKDGPDSQATGEMGGDVFTQDEQQEQNVRGGTKGNRPEGEPCVLPDFSIKPANQKRS